MRKAMLSARLVLLALAFCLAAVSRAGIEIGAPAPALKGVLLSGAPFDLAAMKGKVVLVNFYSSYCKFCAYEIGNIETFYEQHKESGFAVIAVGVDSLADRARVQRMLSIYSLPGCMADELEVNEYGRKHATPTAFVIDKQGVLRHVLRGAKLPHTFDRLIAPLLSE